MPRKANDFNKPDDIYDKLEIESDKRNARSIDDMTNEAEKYRALFK
jgi:hypothetical protein